MRYACIIGGIALLLAGECGWGQQITLVQDGEPRARIVVSYQAAEQVTAAAQALAQYVKQASGAQLEVVTDNALGDYPGVTVQVGKTALAAEEEIVPPGLDDDGFVICARDRSIIICGPTAWGTEFGVYDFLERYLGVRWLLPGPEGTDVPTRKTIMVSQGTIQDEPVFFSRLFSGWRGEAQLQWARFNRMHGRVSFHHNLLHLFPAEKYTKTHPEFFPMIDGKTRFLPAKTQHRWQPCFTAPGIVDEAVKNIVAYFDAHPQATSYSLGVNDGGGFCRCPRCLARLSGETNFVGLADYSDLYYDWCNQVIERVLKVYPDKWFGCLAYSYVAAPPATVQVHPRLIPYMTYDRMKWIHPAVRAEGHKLTEAWKKMSPTLGWYDYVYGTPYCLPRVYFHQTAEYLRYGQEQGVRVLYAELYPNFGEGPKPYLYLRLEWNPNQDVDALLQKWYVRCVGPAAAPYLQEYYEIWERFWTKDILRSRWFTLRDQYLNFTVPDYLAEVKPEDIRDSRQLLETCLAKCETDKQTARAKLLAQAFEYYAASAQAYLGDRRVRTMDVRTEADAVAVLNIAASAVREAQERRHLALTVYPQDPVLRHPISLERYPALSGKNWGQSGLWAVIDWVAKGNNVVWEQVAKLARESTCELLRDDARLVLAIANNETTLVSRNPSFEEGKGTVAADWDYWVKPDPYTHKSVGTMQRVEGVAHIGKASLLCDGMYRGAPVQKMRDLAPGRYCALARVYVPRGQVSTGTVELVVVPREAQRKNLEAGRFSSMKLVPPPGQWTLLVASGEITKSVQGQEVDHVILLPIVDGFAAGGKVYWDDVALYRVDLSD